MYVFTEFQDSNEPARQVCNVNTNEMCEVEENVRRMEGEGWGKGGGTYIGWRVEEKNVSGFELDVEELKAEDAIERVFKLTDLAAGCAQ